MAQTSTADQVGLNQDRKKTVLDKVDHYQLGQAYLAERGINRKVARNNLVIHSTHGGIPCLPFHYVHPHTGERLLTRYRYLGDPQTFPKDANGKPIKCRAPKGSKNHLYIVESSKDRDDLSVRCRDPKVPVWMQEGEGKTLSMQTLSDELNLNRLVVGVSGCYNWKSNKKPLDDFNWIEWKDREVTLICDSNILTNNDVFNGITKLALHLESLGAKVGLVVTPEGYSGMDDYYADQGASRVNEILSNPILLADWIEQHESLLSKGGKGRDDKPSDYQILKDIIARHLTLWRDANDKNEVFCDLTHHGVRQSHKLKSDYVRKYIRSLMDDALVDHNVNSGTLSQVLDVMDSRTTQAYPALHRYGKDPVTGRVYYDLGDSTWTICEITPEGWSLIPYSECPVKFVRTVATQPQQTPIAGGSLSDLQRLIPWGGGASLLAFGWMLSAFLWNADKPILNLVGSQGSGKTKTIQSLLGIVDPTRGSLSVGLAKREDVFVSSQDKLILTYDNLSKIDNDQSDLLCTISTGGSYRKRKLFTDSDEVILSAHLPQAITSVENVVKRPDLASRCITIKTDSDYTPLSEYQIHKIREEVTPKVLGLLFDCVSIFLGLTDQQLNQAQGSKTRFKTLSAVMSACETRLGIPEGAWVDALNNNALTQQHSLRDSDPLLDALLTLLEYEGEVYRLTAHDLLHKVRLITLQDPGVTHTQLGALLGGSLGNSLRACGYDTRYHRTKLDRRWSITPIVIPPPGGKERDPDSKQNDDEGCHPRHKCHLSAPSKDSSDDTQVTPSDQGVTPTDTPTDTPTQAKGDTPPQRCHQGVTTPNPLPERKGDTCDTGDTLAPCEPCEPCEPSFWEKTSQRLTDTTHNRSPIGIPWAEPLSEGIPAWRWEGYWGEEDREDR
jgi:energy-coupling factor transporter ATP-binding protein EcfA2